jgi:small subunit ribosomal protein S9
MTTKKSKEIKESVEKEETSPKTPYFYAVGRRKTSVARVKIFPTKAKQNSFIVNEKKMDEYFPAGRLSETAASPLSLAGEGVNFEVLANVSGGGVSAQSGAVRLGIARALVVYDETLKKSLKDAGFLTRDSREVERKKAGLKKARKAPQWAKR